MDSVQLEWHDAHSEELDFTHAACIILTLTDSPIWHQLGLRESDLVVSTALHTLLSLFSQWRAGQLRELAHAHEIRVLARDSALSLMDRLETHSCGRCCPTVLVVFRPLRRRRTQVQVERSTTRRAGISAGSHNYMELASEELRRSIISEWQEAFTTEKFNASVCAPCGRRTLSSDLTLVSPSKFDLSLLRNDGIPSVAQPTTYAFELYGEALLNPKGLLDRWRLADVRMCEACRRDLVDRHRMPRLSLANYLYYGFDELPPLVRQAFMATTSTERVLLGRARCSRVSFRFSELRRRPDDADGGPRTAPGSSSKLDPNSQRCMKGNVLVMPQNSTLLNSVLPPDSDTIRDTVCAVFVGTSKPTKDTIGRLGPLLVRKSRLIPLIDFLTSSNAHYIVDTEFHGFSQRNLDSLFGPGTEGQDEGVPCALEIGFIEDCDAIRAAVSDYAGRRDAVDDALDECETMLMENVGYMMGDESDSSTQDMKLKALAHCLSGGRFVRSQAGDRFMPDFENPSLLTWLFPHLDPWGIGGFHEPARDVPISMEEQLKYLLQLDDSPFERDPDFAFVYYNILQKKAVCDSVRFKVKVADQQRIVQELLSVDKKDLERLIGRFKANPKYEPDTPEQQRLVNLVNKVGTMLHELPGTAGYKLKMRNEIRSLVHMKGTPAFFITLNPSDVHHPLVRLFAGDDIRLEGLLAGQELKRWQRLQLVARNPGACARFFHTMISSFVSIVLRHGKPGRGLLGKCTGYYGTVETQGRGTLHCHMLVWLHGHPSPQEMRDMMVDSAQYQSDMFTWLESIVKCELLGTTMVVKETGGPEHRPVMKRSEGYIDPETTLGPSIAGVSADTFALQFASDVNDLVTHSNWHHHTETCWKYLGPGEARTDENCRMCMDGVTRDETSIDEQTGSILLRRLHPRIANYNDVIIFLLRANMEIKHVGSGEGAKALIYYVTDYITKASLPTHVGLAALLYAINRTRDKYRDVPNWEETRSAGALTVVVNSMMARLEIPHQQVMSYLIGGGDSYKSDKFRVLHYGSFERLVLRHWIPEEYAAPVVSSGTTSQGQIHQPAPRETAATGSEPEDVTVACFETLWRADDNVTLVLGAGSISAVNQQHDYLYRPIDEPFASMGLYEYIGMSEKITMDADSRRILRRQDSGPAGRRSGRPAEARASFSPQHPQHGTHLVRKRTMWVVPVLLGDRLPRPDRSDDEREQWARTVLTLFKPWRHPSELKDPSDTWYDAYVQYAPAISQEHMRIIHNMNVLSECKDARDKASLARKRTQHPSAVSVDRPPLPDPFDVFASRDDLPEDRVPRPVVGNDGEPSQSTLLRELDVNLGTRFRHAIDKCYSSRGQSSRISRSYGTPTILTDELQARLTTEHAVMRQLKRKRRPDDDQEHLHNSDRNVRRRLDRPPILDSMSIDEDSSPSGALRGSVPTYDPLDVIYQVILEKNLRTNPEQLRAFELVAKHVTVGGPQLLMYVGGVGGTGKSHVVNSILRLFTLLGKRKRILVAAPTGAAAILIGGHTIHSLTMLPDNRGKDLQELSRIWDGVDYLILDEISMVGAKFLSQLNSRMTRAKGYTGPDCDLPFGGVNVIFTGDFGQLKPVRDLALYSHSLVSDPALDSCRGKVFIGALMGAYLWRIVNTVVLLKINQRQAQDREYADLLSRVRTGNASSMDRAGQKSDYAVLKSRYADRLASIDGDSFDRFRDAPVIVGRRKLRDLLNLRIMGHHAESISAMVHLYHARDKIAGQEVTGDDRVRLWQVSSTVTQDSLGKLPLFPGMKVMVQENLAFGNRVVNGTEGTVKDIVFEEHDGVRYPSVVYIHVPGAGKLGIDAPDDVVPIFPEWTSFPWSISKGGEPIPVSVSRMQLPLLPAYAYTDYKSQGRSLDYAIIDPSTASTLQGVYVMLSRVRALDGLAILRPFKPAKIEQRLSEELRDELQRLTELDNTTCCDFPSVFNA